MELMTAIALAALLILGVRWLLEDRSPIAETSTKAHKPASAAELKALLAAHTHVVVDFYADWCPPCRAITPVFSELADRHSSEGYLAFAKINVDKVQDVAGVYGVSAMPTFLFFEGGKPRGVKVAGGKFTPSPSVVLDGEGGVERIRGADRVALMAAVMSLAEKGVKEGE